MNSVGSRYNHVRFQCQMGDKANDEELETGHRADTGPREK